MWVRTTVTIERWTKQGDACTHEHHLRQNVNRSPSWERGHLLAGVASSTDTSTFSEGDFKETDRCCWKHKRCSGHIVHPLIPDYGHHKLHLHTVNHCDCDSRCKSYRPVSVAVIHHPIHREFVEDDLNEDEEEEASKPPIPTQVGPTTKPPDTSTGTVTGTATGTPDSAAPITIWRSESPTGKSQGNKVSPVKSEPSPADLGRSISPRELARMSESSPDSREDLESEGSYNDPRQEEPSSEDPVESPSPRKREKNTNQNKKSGGRSQVRKVNKRKSPPTSNPNVS
uniref:Protein interacting with cyclin A1 n=1 Tax=Loxodonta africana TaxID=9785 RepID=G3TY72_LOXAF